VTGVASRLGSLEADWGGQTARHLVEEWESTYSLGSCEARLVRKTTIGRKCCRIGCTSFKLYAATVLRCIRIHLCGQPYESTTQAGAGLVFYLSTPFPLPGPTPSIPAGMTQLPVPKSCIAPFTLMRIAYPRSGREAWKTITRIAFHNASTFGSCRQAG
jgi:hypothetical protein